MTQVAFIHIHKCGGSTLRNVLGSVYPYATQYPAPMDYQSSKATYRTQPNDVPQVMRYLSNQDTSEFQLFMGHYDWQIVKLLDNKPIVLTMLRNPVDQLYSQFRYFWVDTKTYGFYKDRYTSSGFEGFLSEDHVLNFTNHQTRFLGGRFWGYAASDLNNGVLTSAKKNLKKCVYGLVERWDESIALFEQAIGQKLPVAIIENFNHKYRAEPLSERVIEAATTLQSYDMSLYDYALEHFEDQF